MDFGIPENHHYQGRFISQTNDMTVNLIPGFLAYTAGVAGNIHLFHWSWKIVLYLYQHLHSLHQVFLEIPIFYPLHQVGHQTSQAVPHKMSLVFCILFCVFYHNFHSALPPVIPTQPVDAQHYYYQPQQPAQPVYQPEPIQYQQQALPLPPPQPRVNLPYPPQPVQTVEHYQTGGFLPSPHDNKVKWFSKEVKQTNLFIFRPINNKPIQMMWIFTTSWCIFKKNWGDFKRQNNFWAMPCQTDILN